MELQWKSITEITGKLTKCREIKTYTSSFSALPRVRDPRSIVLGFQYNIKRNVDAVGSPWYPAVKEMDVLSSLAAQTHLSGTNNDFQMEQYICKRKSDSIFDINLKRTWEKLLPAACAIANPADTRVRSSKTPGQWALLKLLLLWSHPFVVLHSWNLP